MEYLVLYILLATATAIHAIYELLWPVIWQREKDSLPTENKYLIYFTFFCINLLIAPIVFLSCIIPSWGDRFRQALEKGLFLQE